MIVQVIHTVYIIMYHILSRVYIHINTLLIALIYYMYTALHTYTAHAYCVYYTSRELTLYTVLLYYSVGKHGSNLLLFTNVLTAAILPTLAPPRQTSVA